MNRLRFSVCITLFAWMFACCDRSQAQCYVNVTKSCGAEQFSNACDGNCAGVASGMDCGLWVDGNRNMNFASVGLADLGSDLTVSIPQPRFCGTVKKCQCKGPLNDLPAFCARVHVFYSDYWVHESQTEGDFCLEPLP